MPSNLRKIENLALLSSQMRTCLQAGLTASKALETASNRGFPESLRRGLRQAASETRNGATLSESLKLTQKNLPSFTLPFIQAGEISGQSTEAFEYLERLCDKLVPLMRIVRQLWVIPVSIMLFGAIVRVVIMVYFGAMADAMGLILDTLIACAIAILVISAIRRTRQGRHWLDYLLATVPYIGHATRAISLGLFFQGLKFTYKAGGRDFRTLLGSALATVPNLYIRSDLSQIDSSLESGLTLPEALDSPRLLDDTTRQCLASGALVGRLEESLDRVTEQLTSGLEAYLPFVKTILARILGYAVIGSVIGTIQMYL
jgi:type II secretory pathway component PulF